MQKYIEFILPSYSKMSKKRYQKKKYNPSNKFLKYFICDSSSRFNILRDCAK